MMDFQKPQSIEESDMPEAPKGEMGGENLDDVRELVDVCEEKLSSGKVSKKDAIVTLVNELKRMSMGKPVGAKSGRMESNVKASMPTPEESVGSMDEGGI